MKSADENGPPDVIVWHGLQRVSLGLGWRWRLLGCALGFCAAGQAEEIWRLDRLEQIGGHAVTLVGSPRVEASEVGDATVFDGARDGVFVSAVPIAGAKVFTIEVLLSPAEGGGKEQRFFHVQDADGRRALLELRVNGAGGWWLDTFLRTNLDPADKGLVLIDPNRVHPTGRWYWVAMRYDGAQLTSYVNGQKELAGEAKLIPLGDGKVSLGVRQNLVSWFKGAIREVRFHRAALPEERLQRIAP